MCILWSCKIWDHLLTLDNQYNFGNIYLDTRKVETFGNINKAGLVSVLALVGSNYDLTSIRVLSHDHE